MARILSKFPQLSKNDKGVTLIEVIAVIAVFSVVAAAIAGFVITGVKMSAGVSAEAFLSKREQTAVEFIDRSVWKAGSIEPYDNEQYKKLALLAESYGYPEIAKMISDRNKGMAITLDNGQKAYIYTWIDIEKLTPVLMQLGSDENGAISIGKAIAIADSVKVVYQVGETGDPVTLCPGYIVVSVFNETQTVTYSLNRETHVVHKRVE